VPVVVQDASLESASWVRERRSAHASERAERAAAAAERAAAVAQRAADSARRSSAAEPRPYYRRVRQHLEAGCAHLSPCCETIAILQHCEDIHSSLSEIWTHSRMALAVKQGYFLCRADAVWSYFSSKGQSVRPPHNSHACHVAGPPRGIMRRWRRCARCRPTPCSPGAAASTNAGSGRCRWRRMPAQVRTAQLLRRAASGGLKSGSGESCERCFKAM